MKQRHATALAIFAGSAIFAASLGVVIASNRGVWIKAGPPAQINIGCIQVWACSTGQDVLHSSNSYVSKTPNEWTAGVCNAAGGAADSCGECSAAPPKTSCEWDIQEISNK